MADDALKLLVTEITYALRPVADAVVEEPVGQGLKRLALEVGYDLDGLLDGQTSTDFATAFSTAYRTLWGLVADPEAFATKLPDALQAIAALTNELQELDSVLPDSSELGKRLFDFLVTAYVEERAPPLYALFVFVGIVRLTEVAAAGSVPAYVLREVAWDQFTALMNPEQVFEDLYGWGTGTLDSNTLLRRLSDVLWALGLPATYAGDRTPGSGGTMNVGGTLQTGPATSMIGIQAAQAPAEGSQPPGLNFAPAGLVSVGHELNLDGWKLSFEVSAGATSGYRVSLRPGGTVNIGPAPGQPAVSWTLQAKLGLARMAAPGARTVLFGAPNGARLEAESVGVTARVQAQAEGGDAAIELDVRHGRIVVTVGDGDSFLREILPPDGFTAEFDLTVGWSSSRGLYLGGAAGLETEVPLDLQMGPIRLKSVDLAVQALDDGRLQVSAGASAGLDLSVLALSIDRVGFDANFDLQPPFDAELVFRPPTGVGLAVDTPAIRAGGFLLFDTERGRYLGAVEISVVDTFDLAAIGVITTRMPDGSEGFSLLLIISIMFPVPIPLGYNFYLAGAGGLLGLNRSVDIDRLLIGLRSGAADSILFPQDIVRRMDAIVRDVEESFPVAEGQFLVGPVALITWSAPPLISVKLGLIIEIGTPVRIAILGVLRAALPDESDPVVDLKVAFLGAIDIDASLLSFDASIYDSYIGRGDFKLSLEGDIALRVSWGPQPEFVTSAGGFHPLYKPPAHLKLPSMRRLSLSLLKDNPRLQLATYVAVTSNTAQLGAKLDFKLEIAGFSVIGEFGFDVLFQFSPFMFMADVRARLAVKAGGAELLTLSLEFSLCGPTPWIARGRAKFKILFFSVSVQFEKRFGEEALSTLPDLAVLPEVIRQFEHAANWRGELGSGATTLVQLFPIEPSGASVVIDAGGVVSVSQRVLPLDTDFSLFGTSRPTDAQRVTIDELSLGVTVVDTDDVTDMFAPAAFQELSDRDKLAAPPYEARPSGKRATGDAQLRTDYVLRRPVQYELVLSDIEAGGEEERLGPREEPRESFEALVPGGAAGRSELARKRARAGERGSLLDASEPRELFGVTSLQDLRPLREDGTVAAPQSVDADGRPAYAPGVILLRTDAEARRQALIDAGWTAGDLLIVPEVQLAA